jgi:hypothetical protein
LICLALHDANPKPRAQPGPCEGLKRTNSGSEPDKLSLIRGEVLNKTAAFPAQGSRSPQLPEPTGDQEKLLSCPDDKKLRTVWCTKAGSVARLQAAREIHRFALYFEQREAEADCWTR